MSTNIDLTVVKTNHGDISIESKNGKLYIWIGKNVPATIIHANAGLPGICGPHIEHDLQEITQKVIDEQLELSRKVKF